ncbi:hypothetical protein PVK06_030567 [Gossypium arboreum]|uniref:Uncharacterized protein n=1 Tax=Gossypium arboreum TaxID=29729 RepID=A0ABR0NNM5_GOSAR|nr:hypothetical protein PVK06_030567 [Gossypium arboreum]
MLMRENERILNEIERRRRKMKEKEFEKGKESERTKKAIEIAKECDKEFSRKMSNLSDCDDNVKSLNPCAKYSCIYMPVRKRFERLDCLHIFMLKYFSFGMCDLLMKAKFLLHFGTNDQNHVFKPRAYVPKLLLRKGDTLKWFFPKEGGHASNPLSCRTFCGSQVFGNNFIKFMSKGVCDFERFFVSKWPDLRTNRLQEGGYDTAQAASCFDTT